MNDQPDVYQPRDQQWLQEACELVKNKMPATHAFVVFAFPVKGTDRCYYASNAARQDAIAALKEWLAYQERADNWMKHDDGPPPRFCFVQRDSGFSIDAEDYPAV